MSLSQLSVRHLKFIACLVFGWVVLAAPSLAARDMTEYGRYLGTRLRLYEEAYETLDKIIAKGTEAEKRRATQVKAEVIKHEADFLFSQDGDEDARNDRYEKALKIFGNPGESDYQGILDKSLMQYTVAQALQRTAPETARDYCDRAIAALKASLAKLEELRVESEQAFRRVYPVYSKTYFHYCRGYYVKSLTYEMGSGQRNSLLAECERELGNFQFGLDDATEELVLSFELQGDMDIARGQNEAAVGKFIDLVKFLADSDPNDYIGGIALRNGYLRAAELLTTELDFDPRFLKQCLDLYSEAYARYGSQRELATLFKSFQLYRISAQIKLGDARQIQEAIDTLFLLARDRDAGFRRQALTVLADIAMRESLDRELRFRCAGVPYRELATLPVSVMIRLAQAYQSILASCADTQSFEAFGPACMERAADIYSRMWRFVDATLMYREACTRTAYFQAKFNESTPLPAHMADRTELIKDGKTAAEFPGKMANEFAKHAGFLTNARFGEPGNPFFAKLKRDADEIKAMLGGDEALLDKAYADANAAYGNRQLAQSAVRFASLPTRYRRYHLGLAQTAGAYYELAYDSNSQRISSMGAREERESDQWFAEQRDRHAVDLAALPESMWKGHESHWQMIMDNQTPGPVANWHKAIYFYKKYCLVEALRNWAEIEPLLKDKEKPDYLDGLFAVAQMRNTRWLVANPTGRGEPDVDMRRMGVAMHFFAYMLRNPVKEFGDEAALKAVREQYRPDALRVLNQYWKLFGAHLAGRDEYKQKTLQMAFYALSEARDVEGAEEAYLAYAEAFPAEASEANKREIGRMVSNVYALLIETVQPRTNAMTLVSTKLRSASNVLKKGAFNNVDAKRFPEVAKKLEETKDEYQRQLLLADHFWAEYMVKDVFENERAKDARSALPDIPDMLKQRWDELARTGPERWADAVAAMLADLLKRDAYKVAKPAVDKELTGASKFEVYGRLRALRDKGGLPDDQMQALSSLFTALTLDTEQLRYFQGMVFIYEWGGFLEKVADDVDERARPLVTRILKYFEEYRVKTGRAEQGLESGALMTLGTQYFRVRDWGNAVRYLQEFLDKHGTVREYGKEEEVQIDRTAKTAGRTKSGEEIQLKYMLGKAYLERYREKGAPDDLRRAALLMRRCWCFNLVRDANEIGNKAFKLQFQKEIEDYYLYIGQNMAEIFRLLESAPADIKVEWPKYANQYTTTLEVDKNNPLQEVPTDRISYLWHAREIHLRLWSSFKKLDYYQYRAEFRDSLLAWLELGTEWIGKYAKDPAAPK
ncbi:MAG: hypothetical protein KJ044_05350, partial [Planctomycetes bacterium]|nr:hypothetical protein [Planctomycetota bacterium]